MSMEKQGRNRITALLLVILLLISMLPAARAAEPDPMDLGTVELSCEVQDGVCQLTPNIMEDLFALDGTVYPGASWKKTVHVVNNSPGTTDFLILSCTPAPGSNTALFDALTAKVVVGGKEVYSGPYGAGSKQQPMTESFRINKGDALDFEITVSLPPTVGNEVQGASLDSIWEFANNYTAPPNSTTQYTVQYVDEAGNRLHEDKKGTAEIGSTVTEQALSIKDYTPDKQAKSLEITRTSNDNVITFIYARTGNNPISSPDNPEGVRTGVELEGDNSMMTYILIFSIIICTIVAGLVIWKMVFTSKKKDALCNREEDIHHGE